MLRYLLPLLFIFALPAYAAPEIGKPAPQFTATDTKGNEVSLDSLKGKKVILEWSNHQCPFVVKHYKPGNMQKVQKHARSLGAEWITIISSAEGKQGHVSAEEANALTTERGAEPSHVLLDASGEIGRMYEAKTTPHMFIIDEKGMLTYMGAIDDKRSADPTDVLTAKNYVTTALEKMKNGEAVETPVTPPYGCSVKY